MDVLDPNTLEALRGLQDEGDDDLLAELIDLFLEDAPTRVAGMREAIGREDWRGAGLVGAQPEGQLRQPRARCTWPSSARRLEQHGRDGAVRPGRRSDVPRARATVRRWCCDGAAARARRDARDARLQARASAVDAAPTGRGAATLDARSAPRLFSSVRARLWSERDARPRPIGRSSPSWASRSEEVERQLRLFAEPPPPPRLDRPCTRR